MASLNLTQLKKLFNLASVDMPDVVTDNDINKALIAIEKKIALVEADKFVSSVSGAPSVLIVDDLEITVHQLGLLLGKTGYNVSVARTAVDAVDLFKKRHYDYVLVDLFLPDPEDGFNLLSDLTHMNKIKPDNSKFIVISGTDDKKLIKECFVKGADEFIGKDVNWHINILKYISFLEKQKKGVNEEIISNVEDEKFKIVSIQILNFHKDSVLQALNKEIKYWLYLGYPNIIVDLEHIYNINSKEIAALISCYKDLSEHNGKLVLCGVKSAVNEVLSYVFLHNVLKIFESKSDAISALKA